LFEPSNKKLSRLSDLKQKETKNIMTETDTSSTRRGTIYKRTAAEQGGSPPKVAKLPSMMQWLSGETSGIAPNTAPNTAPKNTAPNTAPTQVPANIVPGPTQKQGEQPVQPIVSLPIQQPIQTPAVIDVDAAELAGMSN